MSHNITVQGGTSVRLKTAGKYCDRDIVVTAEGGGSEQTPTQEKTISIVKNGTVAVTPDEGYTLSKVTASVNVPIPDGYIVPSGTKQITSNGTHDATEFAEVDVDVPIPDGYIVPSGALEIAENGEYDVSEKARVVVAVPTGGGEPTNGLPAGYNKADFIQFSGAQAVDTGIIGNRNTKIKVRFTRESATTQYLYGALSPDNTATVTAYVSTTSGNWRFGNATKSIGVTKSDAIHVAEVDYKNVVMDGVTKYAYGTVDDFQTPQPVAVGDGRSSGGGLSGSKFVGKVLTFEMWDGSNQVLRLIPVTDGNGVYRFWDAIGEKFHDSMTSTPLEGGNL